MIVDDEEFLLELFERALTSWGFEVETYSSAESAWERLQQNFFHLIFSDINMPGRGGGWLLERVQELPSQPMVFMITGMGDMELAIHCLTNGAYDFLTKPVDLKLMKQKVKGCLEVIDLAESRKHYLKLIEEMAISERWRAQNLFLSGVDALIRALEAKDEYTEGHSSRVAIITEALATRMDLRSTEINEIVTAARCHDIGKIGVPDSVLLKTGRLTQEEFDQIKVHPVESARILAPIFTEMPGVISIVQHHHEKFNGSGYPDGLHGEAIPLGSRIISIADAYDAMTSNRIYRKALSSKDAVEEIISCSKAHFCPKVVQVFLNFYGEIPSMPNTRDNWQNQRARARHPMQMDLLVRVGDGEPKRTVTRDLSYNGMRIEMDTEVGKGEEIIVQLEGYQPQKAVVTWYRVLPSTNGGSQSEQGLFLPHSDQSYIDFIDEKSSSSEERRDGTRIERVIPADLATGMNASKHNILNISLGGAFIQAQRPLEIGDEIKLSFFLEKPYTEIEVSARVVHRLSLSEAMQMDGGIPGMGVTFDTFAGDGYGQLDSYMHANFSSARL